MNILNRLTPTFCNVLSFKLKPWDIIPVRTKIRDYFPRPRERKRVKEQGFFARLKTPGGRKILMRRILKGRHVLGH